MACILFPAFNFSGFSCAKIDFVDIHIYTVVHKDYRLQITVFTSLVRTKHKAPYCCDIMRWWRIIWSCHWSVWNHLRPLRQCGSISLFKSRMAKWLGQASQGHEMYCHDLEILGLNPDQVKLELYRDSVSVVFEQKLDIHIIMHFVYSLTAVMLV